MKFVMPGIWVRISVVGAAIWLLLTLGEISEHSATVRSTVDFLARISLGAVTIMGLGLGVQWAVDYIASKKEE